MDIKEIITWIEQEQEITSYMKTRSFIRWKTENNVLMLSIRPLQPDANSGSNIGEKARQPKTSRRQTEETSQTTEEMDQGRKVDWLVQYRNTMTPSPTVAPEQVKWMEQRLRRNVNGILQDLSSLARQTEQLYQQGREWFQDQQVGQFLDKLRNTARQPEFSRTSARESIRLYISNIMPDPKKSSSQE
jgi:hypothetical protein